MTKNTFYLLWLLGFFLTPLITWMCVVFVEHKVKRKFEREALEDQDWINNEALNAKRQGRIPRPCPSRPIYY
jgi:hypothetical protein